MQYVLARLVIQEVKKMQCVAMCTCVCGKIADTSVNTTACIILNVYVMWDVLITGSGFALQCFHCLAVNSCCMTAILLTCTILHA